MNVFSLTTSLIRSHKPQAHVTQATGQVRAQLRLVPFGRNLRPNTGPRCQRSADIHVDHQDRSTDFLGQPTMPEIFLSQTQLLAVDFLERCVHDMQPLAALTGAVGTGKTVALNTALARRESAGDRVIRVHNFVAGPLSLHRTLASSLGVVDAGELSAEA